MYINKKIFGRRVVFETESKPSLFILIIEKKKKNENSFDYFTINCEPKKYLERYKEYKFTKEHREEIIKDFGEDVYIYKFRDIFTNKHFPKF